MFFLWGGVVSLRSFFFGMLMVCFFGLVAFGCFFLFIDAAFFVRSMVFGCFGLLFFTWCFLLIYLFYIV